MLSVYSGLDVGSKKMTNPHYSSENSLSLPQHVNPSTLYRLRPEGVVSYRTIGGTVCKDGARTPYRKYEDCRGVFLVLSLSNGYFFFPSRAINI